MARKGQLHEIFYVDENPNEEVLARRTIDFTDICKCAGLNSVPLLVAAPMVRYSKVPFRQLVRLYSADVAFSPMLYAKHFVASEQCRNAELLTCPGDCPTVVQFASNDPVEFANAAELVFRFCSGVDLNCGCPQREAIKVGCGSYLLSDPALIADIIATTRRKISNTRFTISAKIRLSENLEQTVELCRRAEHCGASFITVHGRTAEQRREPPDYSAIKIIKSVMNIPVIANGDIKSIQKAAEVAKYTNVDGVMAANGLLENPAMYAGYRNTPSQCVADWLRLCMEYGHPMDLCHQQLIFMLRSSLTAKQRALFNVIKGYPAIIDYLKNYVPETQHFLP